MDDDSHSVIHTAITPPRADKGQYTTGRKPLIQKSKYFCQERTKAMEYKTLSPTSARPS